jgi:hypothetical protein
MILLLICFSVLVPIAVKLFRPHTITWLEMTVHMLVAAAFVVAGWQIGKYADTQDVEIWNGALVSKDRNHGSYQQSYECRCRTVTRGSGDNRYTTRVCDTCWRTIYTVTWSFDTTVGNMLVNRRESRSRGVYRADDPEIYDWADFERVWIKTL